MLKKIALPALAGFSLIFAQALVGPALAEDANPHGGMQMPSGHGDMQGMPGMEGMPAGHGAGMDMQNPHSDHPVNVSASAKKAQVVVPPDVAGKWKAATFVVVDRKASWAKEVTIGLNGQSVLPDSGVTVAVKEFLPDLKISDNVFTSVSNDPKNPAAHVVITEKGKELFDGWMFSEFPSVHRFEHERFGITLKAGVPAM